MCLSVGDLDGNVYIDISVDLHSCRDKNTFTRLLLFFTGASKLSQLEMTAWLYDVQTFSDVFIDLVVSKGLITSANTIPCRIRIAFLTLQSLCNY